MNGFKVTTTLCVFSAIAFAAPANAAFITADFSGAVFDSTSSIPAGTPVTGFFGFETDPVIADSDNPTPDSDYWLADSGPDFVSYFDSNFSNPDSTTHSVRLQFSILGTQYGEGSWFLPTGLTIRNATDRQHLVLNFNANRTVYDFEIIGPMNSMFESLDVRSFNPQGFSLLGGAGFFGFPSGLEGTNFSVDTVHFNVESVPEPASLMLLGLGLAALGVSCRRRVRPQGTARFTRAETDVPLPL